MRPILASFLLLGVAVGDAGCPHKSTELGDAAVDHHRAAVADATIEPPRALDLLFVVDDSGSMHEEQAALAASFPQMLDSITQAAGTLPDLHVGVISTNVGAGLNGIAQCNPPGDDGQLLAGPPGGAACAGLDGGAKFVSDVADTGGARTRNYTGPIEDVFSCMANLGTTGCGLEQPLASLRRALDPSNTPNAGFLRADARLAIVIISDEDDCSTRDTAMFSPANTTLGPINFRCTAYGVTCDGDPDMLDFGARSNCKPNEASAYMNGVAEYVDYVKSLKTDPSLVFVAGLLGPAQPFAIGPDTYEMKPTDPALQGSCESANGRAVPAVRTRAFLAGFTGQHADASICDGLADQFDALGTAIATPLGGACVVAELFDADPATAGLQPSCDVTIAPPTGAGSPMIACGGTGTKVTPCWSLVDDPDQCGLTYQHLRLQVDWGTAAPAAGTHVRASCDVP